MTIVLTDGKENAKDYIAMIERLGGEVTPEVADTVARKEAVKAEEAALSL